MEVLGANAQVRSGSPGEVLAGRIERAHRAALILTFGAAPTRSSATSSRRPGSAFPWPGARPLCGGTNGLHAHRSAGRARRTGQEDPGAAGGCGPWGPGYPVECPGKQSGTQRNGSGPTSPRRGCSRPGCLRRSAGRGSDCWSTVRCWPRSAGPSRTCPTSPRSCSGEGAIAEFGSPPQRARWAFPAGQGAVVLTAALAEEDGDDPRFPSASAVRRDGPRIPVGAVRRGSRGTRPSAGGLVPGARLDGGRGDGIPGLAVG